VDIFHFFYISPLPRFYFFFNSVELYVQVFFHLASAVTTV
jgi:hypothetical protein